MEKKIRCAGPEIFLRFETDLNFSRPRFSEIKVQIKWPKNNMFLALHRRKKLAERFVARLALFLLPLHNKSDKKLATQVKK